MRTSRRVLAPFFVSCALAGACGGQRAPGQPPPSTAPEAALASDGGVAPEVTAPTIEIVAQRARAEAPLLREILRVGDVGAGLEIDAATTDACFRAFLGAGEPVTAWFEDPARDRLGPSFTGTLGAVPEAGPLCVRKGTRLRLVVNRTTPTTVRAVVVGTK